MTKYLIALIIATTIYVALTVASYFTKYRKGKSFEFLNGITQLSSAFVWIALKIGISSYGGVGAMSNM